MSAKQVYTKYPTEIRHMNVKFIVSDSVRLCLVQHMSGMYCSCITLYVAAMLEKC